MSEPGTLVGQDSHRPEVEVRVRWVGRGEPYLPRYGSLLAAGADLRADVASSVSIQPGCRSLVPTGIAVELPPGTEAQVRPRSGLALRHGITVANSPGTIDADYRGEISTVLINLGAEPYSVKPGERIAQLVVAPVLLARWKSAETLNETSRGSGGFGSSGVE